MAIAPCPGAGSQSASSSGVPTPLRPSRSSPAFARKVACASPAASRARRVSTFPRKLTMRQSGLALSSCAARRGALVPTVAPSGSAEMQTAPISTSRISARSSTAPITNSAGRAVSTSFAEWTAISIRPSPSQWSSSRVHRAFPPISASGRSIILSPLATTGTSSMASAGQPCASHKRWRACSACAIARGERRVPRRSLTESGVGGVMAGGLP